MDETNQNRTNPKRRKDLGKKITFSRTGAPSFLSRDLRGTTLPALEADNFLRASKVCTTLMPFSCPSRSFIEKIDYKKEP